MCTSKSHRHSILCILPPYILRNIATSENTSTRLRNMALNALSIDTTFRSLRMGPRITSDLNKKLPSSFAMAGDKQRTIFTANNTQTFPGVVVRTEGSAPSGDPAIDEAYDGLGTTYDFYWDIFTRNSIDDEGLPLNGIVHFGTDYSNAFWDGQRMVFGDGDNELFNRFTISLDVIAHELTHGVTEDEAQLIYAYQSGALNESISDVFGSQDNGGVHINSGIPNHAFYLAAINIGGNAWEKVGQIWYETILDPRLKPNAKFKRFAQLTTVYARRYNLEKEVREAWAEVGIRFR